MRHTAASTAFHTYMRLRLQPVVGNVSQLRPQTDAPGPPFHPCEISSAFNQRLLHLQLPPSNCTPLKKESASAFSSTGSVLSSTPCGTSSPTPIPKILYRQSRMTALNQAIFHITRMTRTAKPSKSPTTSTYLPVNPPRDPEN